MLATEYSSLRTPQKKTKTPPKHALPTIFQSSSIYPTISQIPVVLQWHPHATLGLNASSHHCRRCRPTTSTTSRHHATWRIGGRARPKTSQNVAPGGCFSNWWVFFVFFVGWCVWKVKVDVMGPSCFEAQICRCTQVYSCMTCLWLTSPSSKKEATWSLILLFCWHFIDVKQRSGDFEDRGFSRSTWT